MFPDIKMKTAYMIQVIRENAIAETYAAWERATRHYYKTCDGGDECTKLYHELEELGIDMEQVVDRDLEIRDEVFGK